MAAEVFWHHHQVTKADRRRLNGHGSCVVWFTGLPSSGKSTIAGLVEQRLHQLGVHTYLLDGDNVRHGLNRDLGFSPRDREENIRRVGEVAKLFVDAGLIVLVAFVSPYRRDRDRARALLEPGEFIEVYVRCPVEVCARRDPKGLYRRARRGELAEFTGVSAPYEEPLRPELVLDSDRCPPEECAARVVDYLRQRGIVGGY